MRPCVIVDPSCFWVLVTEEISRPEFEDWLSASSTWREAGNRNSFFDIRYSSKSLERLTELGLFPATNYFSKVISNTDLDGVVDPRQLATSVARFLSETPTVEEDMPINDCLFSEFECDALIEIESPDLTEVSSASLALAIANKLFYGAKGNIIGYAYPRIGKTSERSFRIELITVDSVEPFKVPDEEVQGQIVVVARHRDLLSAFSSEAIWSAAEIAQEIGLAIKVGAIEDNSGGSRDFSVRDAFVEDLKNAQAIGLGKYAQVVLQKCVQIVCDSPNLSSAPLRYSANATSAPRKRTCDNAAAKRMHVTSGHQALRLMYWDRTDRIIEIATLRNKTDVCIEGEVASTPLEFK